MIDRKKVVPIGPRVRERKSFRDVSFEWVNQSRTATHRFVALELNRPSIEVEPQECALIPDQWYRIYSSDGGRPEGRMNFGDAKCKRCRRKK